MNNSASKNVVVIGGGYAGAHLVSSLERDLPADYTLVLLEKRDYYFHNMSGLRAAVDPSLKFAKSSLIPLDKLLKRPTSRLIQGLVVNVGKDSLVYGDSESHEISLDFQYLVRVVRK
jgi:NADH dehydrogenase FAD-containing subunit